MTGARSRPMAADGRRMRTSPPRHPGIELSGSIRVSMERVRAGVGPYIQGRQTMRPSRPPIMRLVGTRARPSCLVWCFI